MVADIRLLQGKIIEDLDQKPKNFSKLIEELAAEIIADDENDQSSQNERSFE